MDRTGVFEASQEPTVAELLRTSAGAGPDRDLAARHAPILIFDAQEPFLPLVVGYTVFREGARSPSAHRYVTLSREGKLKLATAIEYAIWWDWDITHLYELEHIWVYLDDAGEVVHAEGSRHGRYWKMLVDGRPPVTDGHLTVYSEAGKHSFAPSPGWLERLAPVTRKLCTRHAGLEGILITWLYRGIIRKTPESDRVVHTYLERYAFDPSLDLSQVYPIPPQSLVPWRALYEWIPRRIDWWVAQLRQAIPPHRRRLLRIAHRGASAYAPENTVAAMAKAAALGADLVKLDVQHSADGVPVIIHGADLSRTTNGVGPVSQHTVSELQALDAGNGERIPTLDEAITCCLEHHLGLYLELESEPAIEPVVQAIRRRRLYSRVGIGSFWPEWLARVKALDSRITTSILLASPEADAVALAQAAGAEYVHPAWGDQPGGMHSPLTAEWVRAVRGAGLGIICGHEQGTCDHLALRQVGIDGICTSTPEILLPRAG